MESIVTKHRMGLFAGSFNPFHIGHLDIVKQAQLVFDEVMVARGKNPEKSPSVLSPLPINFLNGMGINADYFGGLLSDFIKGLERNLNYDVTLVRGLRSGADLDYEQNFSAFLKGMYPQVKIIAFYCDPKLRHISSSSLRSIKAIAEEEYWKYVVKNDISP